MNEEILVGILTEIKVDLAKVKTDVVWLKRLFSGLIIIIGITFGIDTTGII